MRFIQAGFVGEGPTDAQFLAPLVRRLVEEHLLAHAWALADASALCSVLGVDRAQIDVPAQFTPRHVESISDPNAALEAFAASVPGRHFASPDPELTLLGALALTVDLDVLVDVPQARQLADDIATLAHGQGWLL